jgi:phytanoyl-CoA hydroxylase
MYVPAPTPESSCCAPGPRARACQGRPGPRERPEEPADKRAAASGSQGTALSQAPRRLWWQVEMPLSQSELDTFDEEGWLLAKNVIPHHYIRALQGEIDAAVDEQANKLFEEGKITELHADKGYLQRTSAIWAECPEIWNVVYSGNHAGKAMYQLLTCPELLDIMEQLVGPEIIAAGIYRLRPKLPKRPEGIVPWHQDAGYFGECADNHVGPAVASGGPGYVMTAWVPLMEASAETGPMQVLPRAHRRGVMRHYSANVVAPGLTVHPDHIPNDTPAPITVACSVGDALLFGEWIASNSSFTQLLNCTRSTRTHDAPPQRGKRHGRDPLGRRSALHAARGGVRGFSSLVEAPWHVFARVGTWCVTHGAPIKRET